MKDIKIFAGTASEDLTKDICKNLGIAEGSIYRHVFPSGEHYCQYKDNIRGSDVFLVQSICNPAHEKLMELLVMIDAARRASAGRITVVTPYMGYLRQDRKTKSRTPITAKLVANLLTAAGVDRVVGMDFHCDQAQGFFDIPVDHLYSAPVLIEYLTAQKKADRILTDHLSQSSTISNIVDQLIEAYPKCCITRVPRAEYTQVIISDKPYHTMFEAGAANWAVSFNVNISEVNVEYLKNRWEDAGPNSCVSFNRIPDTSLKVIIPMESYTELQSKIDRAIHQASRSRKPIIVSPDAGGIKRASAFAESYDTEFAYISKKRISDSEVKTYGIVGEVKNRDVLIIDDMTESCGTILEAAKVCKQHGARIVKAAVTHGLLNETAYSRLLSDKNLDELIVTNTVKYDYDSPKVSIVNVAPLLATAIEHIHNDKSVTELFDIKGF